MQRVKPIQVEEAPDLPKRIVQRYADRTPINDREALFFYEMACNPKMVERFRNAALEALRHGQIRYRARTIVEVLRWGDLKGNSKASMNLNDHLIPYLRRWCLETTPELPANFFKLKSDTIEYGMTDKGREYMLALEEAGL